MKQLVWHLICEKPIHKPGQFNQIIVFGQTKYGASFSVCEYIDDDLVYTPVTRKIYFWSELKFTHWAYLEELIPDC